jgi:hypothetical protein
MARQFNVVVVAFSILFAQIGCASIIHGGYQDIYITSTPPKVAVRIDGMHRGQTPVMANLRRGRSHLVEMNLDGHEEYQFMLDSRLSGWIWGNIVFGWIPGFIIDSLTGGAKELHPDSLHANLVPIEKAAN